ncbi:unnamed protein product [Kuraishia capsulata CBS 1993]|uniref:Inositolphosphotransferase Aur1/Ipt1 domain-containing protein n=1 Tax=Kuraishia capsulata CBS 1993 TaxID=1382522 RepID=W6MXR9_9ASCO|nr:uncharacterized protein KUCA_T00005358001 [Kuraishia capsulata CBS 1993]CDK29370.1 unnamed protein product [Kuraishia capsulata CBS 1993]
MTPTTLIKLPLQFVVRIVQSGINRRTIFGLFFNFWLNFSLVFIWLLMFKNAGIVPDSWRPRIHVRFAQNLDRFMFDVHQVSSWVSLGLLVSTAFLLWTYFYYFDETKYVRNTLSSSNSPIYDDYDDDEVQIEMSANKQSLQVQKQTVYFPVGCFRATPVVLVAASWFLLNIEHSFINNFATYKDLIAWFSYVLLHFLSPLFTAIWLYVFQTPGALKYFGLCLGFQNICGVCTHMLFPNAPPWFIHLHGEDAAADYSMQGYAAGLTRVDVALGTHLNSNGFHKSPIVFGALPSLHSAMAVQACLFITYYSRWLTPKFAMLAFVNLQWWATMYLDHHWRLDLVIGLLYAVTVFTVVQPKLKRKEREFVVARSRGNFGSGSTMGMRVFRNTFAQDFFDPYS